MTQLKAYRFTVSYLQVKSEMLLCGYGLSTFPSAGSWFTEFCPVAGRGWVADSGKTSMVSVNDSVR